MPPAPALGLLTVGTQGPRTHPGSNPELRVVFFTCPTLKGLQMCCLLWSFQPWEGRAGPGS